MEENKITIYRKDKNSITSFLNKTIDCNFNCYLCDSFPICVIPSVLNSSIVKKYGGMKEFSCEKCGAILHPLYVKFIKQLEDNNLLQEDFKKKCCRCDVTDAIYKRS